MKILKDIVYNSYDQKLDVYLPEGDVKAVFVFFHGGGIETGDKKVPDFFAEHFTDRDIALISANYRMYPDAKYPEFLEDSADAAAWAYKNSSVLGGCKKIFLGGSSAGGYISMMLCFDGKYLMRNGISPTDICGYVHNAGQPTKHFNVLKYSGVDSRRVIIDDTAPLYHIGLAEKYSPMLFLVSDNDMVNRYEQTMLTISTLKHFGHTQPDVELKVLQGTHCSHDFKRDENGESVFGKLITDFITKHI